ncbi:MAG: hypothetical protein JJU15_08530, partial [Pararhodobacter sp.]|nr:hypothetical protein [Pararhodobacter sp.]
LRAPSEPGMYELRYILDEGRSTLASAPIEVTGAETSISGPDSVRMGERFTINWSDNIDSRDFVAIVPMGADEGTLGTSTRVRSDSSAELRAPSEPGLYELRYILDEGRSTLASAPIEVTGAETSISGPDSVRMGEQFTINWSDSIDSRDFVAIVPMGSDEGTLGTSTRVRSGSSAELRAPSEPGMYELRYILDEGRSTLASAPIEVTAASVEITGPDEVRAGDRLRISWSETIDSRDLIAIVPMGADEGTLGDSTRTRSSNTEHDFTAPEQPGLYEARYVLDEGRGTLASHSFEVLPETAPLDAGAGLEAPERATPGEEVRVTWTAPAADVDRRIVLARTDQPLFSWIEAQPVGDRSETVFTMPSSAGFYEFRLLDISEQAVMGRSVIEVR